MKKIWIKLLCAVLSLLLLAGCGSRMERRELSLLAEVDLMGGKTLFDADTRGGFHGDGERTTLLRYEKQPEGLSKIWKPLPVGAELQSAPIGVESEGEVVRANMLAVKNGYYRFIDRHSAAKDSSDETGLNKRASYHFTLMVYDADEDLLYIYSLDT